MFYDGLDDLKNALGPRDPKRTSRAEKGGLGPPAMRFMGSIGRLDFNGSQVVRSLTHSPTHDLEVTLSITTPYIFLGHQRCLSLVPRAFEERASPKRVQLWDEVQGASYFLSYSPQTTERGRKD